MEKYQPLFSKKGEKVSTCLCLNVKPSPVSVFFLVMPFEIKRPSAVKEECKALIC